MIANTIEIQKYLGFYEGRADAMVQKALVDAGYFSRQIKFIYPVFLTPFVLEELRWTPFDEKKHGFQNEENRVKLLHGTLYQEMRNVVDVVQYLSHKRVPRSVFSGEIMNLKSIITKLNDIERVVIVSKSDENIF